MSYKTTRFWKKIEIIQRDNDEPQTLGPIELSLLCEDERQEIKSELSEEFRYQPATRNSHYTALNCLPVVAGTKWTVSEEVYDEFLETLPPIYLKKGGFAMSEACTGNVRSCYHATGGQIWHEYRVLSRDDIA